MTSHTVTTFCRVCEPACGLVATVKDGRLVQLAPDRDHPVTEGYACHKGLAGLDIHRDPDRLNHPLRRTSTGAFERLEWILILVIRVHRCGFCVACSPVKHFALH